MLGQLSSNRSSGQAGVSVALTPLSVVEHHSPRARAERGIFNLGVGLHRGSGILRGVL